jgi:SAM-dependent methyltransferase
LPRRGALEDGRATREPAWTVFDRVVPFLASFGAAIVDVLDPPPGRRFLDLGAGRGALTGPALSRGCLVTAVDASPAMVARLTADFPAAAVAAAFRVLVPGGRFALPATGHVLRRSAGVWSGPKPAG